MSQPQEPSTVSRGTVTRAQVVAIANKSVCENGLCGLWSVNDLWDLSALCTNETEWMKSADGLLNAAEEITKKFRGHLGESAATLAGMIKENDELYRKIVILGEYAMLKKSEDGGNSTYVGMDGKISSISAKVNSELGWVDPEIFAIPDEKIKSFMDDAAMKDYKRYLTNMLRDKPHTLSADEEKILALAQDVMESPSSIFSALKDVDIVFPEVEKKAGTKVRLTHGNYASFLRDTDRKIRKEAFEAMYNTFTGYTNSFAATLDGVVKKDCFFAKVKKFPSALAGSLHKDNVNPDIYNALIQAIHESLPTLHKYLGLRAKALGVEKLEMYDLHVSMIEDVSQHVEYATGKQWVLDALAPLGKEYLSVVEKAYAERWIDVYENKGKRSGAFSAGCYDSPPYMLLNFDNNIDDVFTLAHEMGHSCHTYFSNKNQKHIDASYKIFVAEVASTVNELLLWDYLVKKFASDKKFIAYMLSSKCDDFRTTVFRQVMFAEFEKITHELVESGTTLTPEKLNEEYLKLNKLYHGENVNSGKLIEVEWARIPHFHYNFYVYKYATSFCASVKISRDILSGDKEAVARYLKFLSSGCSKDPIDLLVELGVDMRNTTVITQAFKMFDETINGLSEHFK